MVPTGQELFSLSSEVPHGASVLLLFPTAQKCLLGQPWSRELSLGQNLDCHYLQGKKKSLVSWQVAPQGIFGRCGQQARPDPMWGRVLVQGVLVG